MTTSFLPSSADISERPDAQPLGGPARSETFTAPREPTAGADLRRVLAAVAAVVATGGGLIHLAEIGDHTEYRVVAAGFAAMGFGQFVVALWLFRRPSRRVLLLAAGLHAAITAAWALSRTVGLWFVPGEAEAAEIGVADVVANTFSLAVIGVVVVLLALHRAAGTTVLPHAVARRMTGVAAAGALILSAIAVSAPHAHGSHAPVVDAPVVGHSHGHDPTLLIPGPRLGTASPDAERPESR